MGPGNWDWQSPLRHIASGGHNTGDVVNGFRWNGEKWEGQGGGSGSGSVPSFNFDWEAARKAAFDPEHPENSVLGRYYLQKLKDAGDDVDRAKRLLQEDYDRGVRISNEDYTKNTRTAQEDYTQSTADATSQAKNETFDTRGQANMRGVLFGENTGENMSNPQAQDSQYAQNFLISPLEQKQKSRQLAIERALQRQNEITGLTKSRTQEELGIAKTRGLEEQNIQYPREQQKLQEETRTNAYNNVVPLQYQEAYQKFRASQGLGG